jgi:hypothetical protein
LPYSAREEEEPQGEPKKYGDKAEIRSKTANEVYEAKESHKKREKT